MRRRGYHLRKHTRTSKYQLSFLAGYTYRNPKAKELMHHIPSKPLGGLRIPEVGPVQVISEGKNIVKAQRPSYGRPNYTLTLTLKGKEFKPPARKSGNTKAKSFTRLKSDLYGDRFKKVWVGSKQVTSMVYPQRKGPPKEGEES